MKRVAQGLLGVLGGVAVLAAAVYGLGTWSVGRALAQRTTLPAVALPVSGDAAQIAHGEHLAQTRGCTDCHGANLAGKQVIDAGPVMQIYAPNLTPGGVALDPVQFEHALRHGIGREGQMLMLMPSKDYSLMSNTDAAALYAYLRSVPAQPDVQPQSSIGPVGRVAYLFDQLPIFEAPRIDHARASRGDEAPPVSDALAYGAYLGHMCRGCHGAELAGGPMPGQPPGVPDPANLTPAGPLAAWTEADFLQAMRTGKRPDGSAINEFMPWRSMSQMHEEELHALWVYLHSLPKA